MTRLSRRVEDLTGLVVFFGLPIFNTIAVLLNCVYGSLRRCWGIWLSVAGGFLLYCGIGGTTDAGGLGRSLDSMHAPQKRMHKVRALREKLPLSIDGEGLRLHLTLRVRTSHNSVWSLMHGIIPPIDL